MASNTRFIDTGVWNEDWFCELGSEYQNFWNYITCSCDNAGIWKPNKIDFEIKSRTKVNMVSFLDKVNEGGCKERILIIENGRWFITGFIHFQWFNKMDSFNLTLSNNLHKHLYEILNKNKISLKKVRGLGEVLQTSKDKDTQDKPTHVLKGGMGENWNTMPGDDERSLELPEVKNGAVVELLRITKKQVATTKDVNDLWEVFKIQSFSGKKWYATKEDTYSHFINWAKTQNIHATDKQTITGNHSNKPGTSSARMQKVNDF